MSLVAALALTACSGGTTDPPAASPAPPSAPTTGPGGDAAAAPTAQAPSPVPAAGDPQQQGTVQIQLTAGDLSLTATLVDSPTADAFAAQLPMTVPISDHASTEKVFYPPAELSTQGAPEGYEPSAGDLAYYSPWGNVAVYYQDFAWSRGLVPLARLDGDPAPLADLPDDTELTIALR
ncbi:cyclophilin-like fold protein [Modestobacter sp. Leaf380]|uniref:cyclophilin-like fold protein n=1 Tax=Modestobacter sp. Leaf380 TaxID=1736356 RepID=UPI0012F9FDD8|nr:cyclophilin-like fold protein [Modestobacter sp. Leaf380]